MISLGFALAALAVLGLLAWRDTAATVAGFIGAGLLQFLALGFAQPRYEYLTLAAALLLLSGNLTYLFGIIIRMLSLNHLRRPLALLGQMAIVCWLLAGQPGLGLPTLWATLFHVLIANIAYGLLALAAVQAGVLTWQIRALRSHRPCANLPALEVGERAFFTLLLSAFVCLSLGLLSGLLYVEDIFAQHLVHKTAFTFVSWSVLAGLLAARYWRGLRGRLAMRWTWAAYILLFIGYFGSKTVLQMLGKL